MKTLLSSALLLSAIGLVATLASSASGVSLHMPGAFTNFTGFVGSGVLLTLLNDYARRPRLALAATAPRSVRCRRSGADHPLAA
jgi:hypothetical protein